MRLAFMGTPDFAVPSLAALVAAGHEVAAVYCQPPRRAGRGHRPRPSPVQAAAERHGLVVRYPDSLKNQAAQAEFAALDLDVAVVAAYGLILPRPVLDAPRLGCINVHASLLPRWRGAAPIQRAIMAGDAETGICIMRMEAGLDTGPVLLSGRLPIDEETTGGSLHDGLARLGAELIVVALDRLAAGALTATPQDDTRATYARKLSRDVGRIDWTAPADALGRLVRALAPRPGAWFEHEGTALRVLAATAVPAGRDAAPGTVLDGRPAVACGTGALRLERLQRPGGGPMDADAFLRGYALPPGTRLDPAAAPCPGTG